MKLTQEQINEIFGIRLILLLEDEPQSNRYRQIKLNPAQFKQLSDFVGKTVASGEVSSEDGLLRADYSNILIEPPIENLPEELRDFYDT